MRDAFNAYPEFVCIDATYKLTDLRIPLYILLVEDSLGQSELVGAALLATEDFETLSWLFEVYIIMSTTSEFFVF